MVSDARYLEKSDAHSDVDEDNSECDGISIDSSQQDCDGVLALAETGNDRNLGFQNIEVINSNDVHFGNKTYYQGPVTIKQIVYANANGNEEDVNGQQQFAIKDKCVIDTSVLNGSENPGYVLDSAPPQSDGYIKNNIDKINNAPTDKGKKWIPVLSRTRYILVFTMAACLLVALASLAAILLIKHLPDDSSNPHYVAEEEEEVNSPIDDASESLTLSDVLTIVDRRGWLALNPKQPANHLPTPVPYVIIQHTATTNCTTQAICKFQMLNVQKFHMYSNGWWDIAYSFLVGGDGLAYEGRGWESEGAHTKGYNTRSIGIGFIGTFNDVLPPKRQLKAAQLLIEFGVKNGYIKDDYKLLAARNVSPTKSPGKLQIVNRGEWVAQAVSKMEPLKRPVRNVIILETGTSCTNKSDCIYYVRHLQTYFIESQGQWDIGYNFLVDSAGLAYEGRGWTVVGHHTLNWNDKSIGIALIGSFETNEPTKEQVKAANQLIMLGIRKGYITKDYKLYTSVQLSKADRVTLLYENVKTWSHFANV